MKSRGFGLLDLVIVLFIFICAVAVLAPIAGKLVGFPATYSEGERTGVITKLSKKGFIFKTWEGEMNLGGMSADSNGAAVPNVWHFSVSDDQLARMGQEYATGAKRVTLQYREVFKSAIWQGNTDYFVTGYRVQ